MSHDKIEEILARVPNYDSFYTTDELDNAAAELAALYPQIVSVSEVGISRAGHSIKMVKLGNGGKNALLFACPHPNEPIGAMTLVTLARILAKDSILLASTNMTFYMIFCIDPDGTKLNENWFKGPFTLENYIRGFYRPPGSAQVEWTFPINYKGLKFDSPIPETRALMKLIKEIKPEFMFSLHNCAFGGAFWYSTDSDPALCEALENAAVRQNIPLHMGEPEANYIEKYSLSVFSMLSMKAYIDAIERETGKLPSLGNSGTCSADYVSEVCECLALMAELPYFYDESIGDSSLSDMPRRKALEIDAHFIREHLENLHALYSRVSEFMSNDDPFAGFVKDWVNARDAITSERQKAAADTPIHIMATVSEVFDNTVLKRIFENLNLALLIRACDLEIQRGNGDKAILESVIAKADVLLKEGITYLEANTNYKVIPIQKLVRIQIESAFAAINKL